MKQKQVRKVGLSDVKHTMCLLSMALAIERLRNFDQEYVEPQRASGAFPQELVL